MNGNKRYFFDFLHPLLVGPIFSSLSFSFISAPFLFPQGAAAAAAPKMVVPQRFREMLSAISKGALDLCVEAPGGGGFSIGVLWL